MSGSFIGVTSASAAPMFELWPHCNDDSYQANESGIFVPDFNDILISLGDGQNCTRYQSVSPELLQTEEFAAGSQFSFDVLIDNAEELDLSSIKAELLFEPSSITIDSIEIDDRYFTEVNPGGDMSSTENGTITLDVQMPEGQTINKEKLRIATITATIQNSAQASSIISFNTVNNVSAIYSNTDEETNLLTGQPASLQVRVANGTTTNDSSAVISDSSSSSAETDEFIQEFDDQDLSNIDDLSDFDTTDLPTSSSVSSSESVTTAKQIGEACVNNNECLSTSCKDNVCRVASGSFSDGESCIVDFQCASYNCDNGTCRAQPNANSQVPPVTQNPTVPSTVSPVNPPNTGTTSFSLLQIQNFQVTTEGATVYLGWDPLESSQILSYNVYYGTTPSQYILRKNVPRTEKSLTIRDLPLGTQYYFAIKGVSSANEETAFSNEISVVIGSPTTSTSPLLAAVTVADPDGITSPITSETITELPGETGSKTTLLLVIIVATVGITSGYYYSKKGIAFTHE